VKVLERGQKEAGSRFGRINPAQHQQAGQQLDRVTL
jgi:hypothetical protein